MSNQPNSTETIRERWGSAVGEGTAGFTAVPSLLIRSQALLGLTSTQLVVLLNVLTHWWRSDDPPYPRPTTIAKRMGIDRRSVERALHALEGMGLIQRLPSEEADGQPAIRRILVDGLVHRLQQLARETGETRR